MCNTWCMAKKGRRETNEERLAAIRMYENGLSPDQITEIMEVGRSSLFEWISKYREGVGSPRYPRSSPPVARRCSRTVRWPVSTS